MIKWFLILLKNLRNVYIDYIVFFALSLIKMLIIDMRYIFFYFSFIWCLLLKLKYTNFVSLFLLLLFLFCFLIVLKYWSVRVLKFFYILDQEHFYITWHWGNGILLCPYLSNIWLFPFCEIWRMCIILLISFVRSFSSQIISKKANEWMIESKTVWLCWLLIITDMCWWHSFDFSFIFVLSIKKRL